jgi:hypothetical protein
MDFQTLVKKKPDRAIDSDNNSQETLLKCLPGQYF